MKALTFEAAKRLRWRLADKRKEVKHAKRRKPIGTWPTLDLLGRRKYWFGHSRWPDRTACQFMPWPIARSAA